MYNDDEKLIPEIAQEENALAPLPPSAGEVPVETPAPVAQPEVPVQAVAPEAQPAAQVETQPPAATEQPVAQPAPAETSAPVETPAPTAAPVVTEKPTETQKPAEPAKEEEAPATAEAPNDPKSVQSPGVQPHNSGFGTHQHISSSRVVSELIEKTEVDGGSLFAFIGDGFDKINGRTINVYALVFGPFYLAYRKLKTPAFFSMIIAWIIALYFRKYYIIIGIYLVLHGLFANGMIMNFARKQVKKIKSEHTSYSSGEITTLCMNAGRPSLGVVISTLIKATLVFLVGNYILARIGLIPNNNFAYKYPDKAINYASSKLNINFSFKMEEEPEIIYRTDYNGTVDLNPKSVNEVLTVTKPESFKQLSLDGADMLEFKHDNEETLSLCHARIYGVLNYKDAVEFAKAFDKFYEGSELTVKSVNGINWYIFDYELNGKNTVYVSNNDKNEIYVYSFLKVGEDECSNEEANILNSINYK